MSLSKISATLFLPFGHSPRIGGGEAREQQPALLLYPFLAGPGMAISNGLPEPAERRFG